MGQEKTVKLNFKCLQTNHTFKAYSTDIVLESLFWHIIFFFQRKYRYLMKSILIKKSWQDAEAQSFKKVFFKSSVSGQKCHHRRKRDKHTKLLTFQGESERVQAFFEKAQIKNVLFMREKQSAVLIFRDHQNIPHLECPLL